MVVLLSYGHGPATVARLGGCSDRVVRKWRARWDAQPRIESLLELATETEQRAASAPFSFRAYPLARLVGQPGRDLVQHPSARDVLGFIRHWNRQEARPFHWTFAGRFVETRERLAA
jgi:hypothetical protein